MNDLSKELSDYIKLQRFISKKNQEEIASKLNVTRQTYTKWENDPCSLTIEKLFKLGEAIGFDAGNFFNLYIAKCNKEQ